MENINIDISPEFYSLLKLYTKSDDPLEDPKFDVAAYLNEKFSDFKSLDKLPQLIDQFQIQISELDEEIDNLMCERAIYNEEMKMYMNELNNDVNKIIELVNEIKANADVNENTVKMICNDIKNLDNARNNITTTISSLTKLIILITGIEKLELFVKERKFKEAANAIAASNDILEYFHDYRHVTQVNNLYVKKENLCASLLGAILDEFKNNIGLVPNNSEHLYEACLAINAIGDNAIRELKTWFTRYKLTPYEEIFDPKVQNPVEFQDTERRFEWLKRILKEYNQIYDNIFPPSWGLKSQLCFDFCRLTKVHINEILMMNLEDSSNKRKIEVDVLVRVLHNTINFENNLHTYLVSDFENFASSSSTMAQLSLHGVRSDSTNPNNDIDDIRIRYEAEQSTRSNVNRPDPNIQPKYSLFRVIGVISESFEPYMNSYVKIEEKKLKEIIDGLQKGDRIEGKLFVSSLHLFNNIKQAMNRCLSFNKSKIFFDLSKMFKDVFRYYIDTILSSKIKAFSSLNKLHDNDLKVISYVINTSDYVTSTITALVDSLKEKIEENYKNQIFYDDVNDHIKQTLKNAFECLINYLKNIANEQFGQMLKMTWTSSKASDAALNSDNVSNFVLIVIKNFENVFIIVKEILQENFVFHILNSIPKLITEAFLSNLYKIKKIDEAGAQKLLMDIYELKGMILKIYNTVNGGNQQMTSRDNDFNLMCLNQAMKKEFSKIESRLKCIGSNLNEMGNAYKTFVEDKSKDDFDKLLAIRGMKKNDIHDYEKIFI
jgi:hypothetical protein